MPVLHALWPRHLSEVDSGPQGWNFSLPEGILHHYIKNFQPFSSISIDNAAPASWPLSGVVIGSQIVEKVGQLIEGLIGIKLKKFNKASVNIEAFIDSLGAYELIPPNYRIGLKGSLTLIIDENHD
jgi:hypothetical protein